MLSVLGEKFDDQTEEADKIQHRVLVDSRVVLIKPQVDASDKELHWRNNMLNAEKNMRKYLDEEGAM